MVLWSNWNLFEKISCVTVLIYTCIIISFLYLLLSRSSYQPIKFRSAKLIFISGLSAHIIALWIIIYLYLGTNDNIFCNLQWLFFILYFSLFMPYILRFYRLLKLYKWSNIDQNNKEEPLITQNNYKTNDSNISTTISSSSSSSVSFIKENTLLKYFLF